MMHMIEHVDAVRRRARGFRWALSALPGLDTGVVPSCQEANMDIDALLLGYYRAVNARTRRFLGGQARYVRGLLGR